MRPSTLLWMSIVIVALAMSGCGSAATTSSGSGPSTMPRAPKLDLASGQRPGTPSSGNAAAVIFPVQPMRYVLEGVLPELGQDAVVWQMKPHSLNATDVQRFAHVFGVAGVPQRTGDGWQVRDANAVLSFFVSDSTVAVSYSFGPTNAVGGSAGTTGTIPPSGAVANRPASVPGSNSIGVAVPPAIPVQPSTVTPAAQPVDVPSVADATSLARTLLTRLGVLAGQQWSSTVNDNGVVGVACAPNVRCPTVPPEVFARTVTFTLQHDGRPVTGVQWAVTIGEHRQVMSVNGEWASPAAIGTYAIRTTAAVFADLQHGRAHLPGPQPELALPGAPASAIATPEPRPTSHAIVPLIVHITGVTAGIARWDAYEHGRPVVDLLPTYRFHARTDGGSSYDIELLALQPDAFTFANQTPVPTPVHGQPQPLPTPAPLPRPDQAPTPPSS
jgi:hypothetical protein